MSYSGYDNILGNNGITLHVLLTLRMIVLLFLIGITSNSNYAYKPDFSLVPQNQV